MFCPDLTTLARQLKESMRMVCEDVDPTVAIKTRDLGKLNNPESSFVIRSSELFSLPDKAGHRFGFVLEIKAEMRVDEGAGVFGHWDPRDPMGGSVGVLVRIEWNPAGENLQRRRPGLSWFQEQASNMGFEDGMFAQRVAFFPYSEQDRLVAWIEGNLAQLGGFVFTARTIGLT